MTQWAREEASCLLTLFIRRATTIAGDERNLLEVLFVV
jgi:hypothetical protein